MRRTWAWYQLALLVHYYPLMGKAWCVCRLGQPESEVRNKASSLGLSARKSAAREATIAAHGEKLRGRKRPEQAAVILGLHASGKLAKTPAQRAATSARVKEWHSANEHPRGMLGKRHSADVLKRISAASRSSAAAKTPDERAAQAHRALRTRTERGHVNTSPHGKWRAAWREIGGVSKYYRSRWEANYARHLECLRGAGAIESWSHEPETFWFDGIKRGCVSYLPDFRVVLHGGAVEYHEVKGWMDDRSKTKLRRMAKYHPAIRLVVIDSKAYKALSRAVSASIEGWE